MDVKCPNKAFTVTTPKEAKAVHLIPLVFTAGDETGRVAEKISIRTDQGQEAVQTLIAYAEVVKGNNPTPAGQTSVSSVKTKPTADDDGPPQPDGK